jgi:membrane protease subunit (stomatin/prohibitin family)
MTGRDPSFAPKDVWECGECGALNPLDENYCENCGYHQYGTPPEGEDENADEE